MIPNSTPDSSEPTPPPADDSPAAVPGDEREEREEMEISDDPDPELAPESPARLRPAPGAAAEVRCRLRT